MTKPLYEVAEEFLKMYAASSSEASSKVVALVESKADKKGYVWVCGGKVYKRKPKNSGNCLHVPKDEAVKLLLGGSGSTIVKIWSAVRDLRIDIPIEAYNVLAGTAYFDGGHVAQAGEWLTFVFAKPEARDKYWREAEKICRVATCVPDRSGVSLSARFA